MIPFHQPSPQARDKRKEAETRLEVGAILIALGLFVTNIFRWRAQAISCGQKYVPFLKAMDSAPIEKPDAIDVLPALICFLVEVAEHGGAEEGVGTGLVTFGVLAEAGDHVAVEARRELEL